MPVYRKFEILIRYKILFKTNTLSLHFGAFHTVLYSPLFYRQIKCYLFTKITITDFKLSMSNSKQ